jgi:hypothetical protein
MNKQKLEKNGGTRRVKERSIIEEAKKGEGFSQNHKVVRGEGEDKCVKGDYPKALPPWELI